MADTSRTPTLAEVLRIALEKHAAALRVSLPGRVERYDATKQLVDVKPLLQDSYVDQDGIEQLVSLPVLKNVPVVFQGAGGFRVTFPVEVGDTVVLMFADRSLDIWKSQGGEVDPKHLHRHGLTDAVAIPGLNPFNAPWTGASTSSMTLGKDGGPQIEITADEVHVGGSSDFLALAGAVKGQLDAFNTALTAAITTLTAGSDPAVSALAELKTELAATPGGWPSSVAATKAKAT